MYGTLLPARKPREDVTHEDVDIPGPAGSPNVRLRIYRPSAAEGILPCLYWIHGGGMAAGSVDADDWTCEGYAHELGCAVVSVEYRLAPEDPYPAPVEDCYAGLRWVAGHGARYGIDRRRVGVGGGSAGGGLAAAVVLLARDRGGPEIIFQLLVRPMLDDRNITPSSREFSGDHPVWNREVNIEAWTAYLGQPIGAADVSPYAAPARATDLASLPPAMIQVGQLEVFRDEAILYAMRLMEAGVSTELHVYPGAFHGWDAFAPDATVSRRSVADRMEALRRALWSTPDAAVPKSR
jgi:acetyl esterase/lipase